MLQRLHVAMPCLLDTACGFEPGPQVVALNSRLSPARGLAPHTPLIPTLDGLPCNSFECFQIPILCLAAATGYMKVFNLVIEMLGAEPPTATDSMKRTALHYAAAKVSDRSGSGNVSFATTLGRTGVLMVVSFVYCLGCYVLIISIAYVDIYMTRIA